MPDYIALFFHTPSGYSVYFPDVPGCTSGGANLDDARTSTVEALALHFASMVEDGDPIPEPSDLDTVMADPDNRDAVAVLIPGPRPRARSVRLQITLPDDVLAEIDARDKNRSRFLADAARDKIARGGWEIDHLNPQSKGGTDRGQKTSALKTKANHRKSDKVGSRRRG